MGKKTNTGCACLICGKTIKIGEKTEWVMVNRKKAFAHFDCLPKKHGTRCPGNGG